jgi:soluble lytic murein transglycosylase-like protein
MAKVSALFSVILALIAALAITSGRADQEATCETTMQATVEETTEYITEPTIEETIPTEATEVTEVTEATEATEPSVTLYDVPLDEELQLHIISEAEEHGIDPAIIVAMAFRESCYTADAIGDNGNSYGLLQIQPRWHYERMQKLGCPDLLDPFQNVTVGVDYLAEMLDWYDCDMGKALTAYNKGHYAGTVTEYALTIMEMAEELGGGK